MGMNEDQLAFLKAAKAYEEVKEIRNKAEEELQLALSKLPLGSYLQDPETLLVYKVVQPKGKFVYYQERDYERTKKADERSGNLSAKEAKENGFVLAV